MKILITGNMGYVGPSVVTRLRSSYPDATLVGVDIGYFAHCLTSPQLLPECLLDRQVFADVRNLPDQLFDGVDVVVHLAAISNDPMGKTFEELTYEVNHRASVKVARQAKEHGARAFIFASSCSMYGLADQMPRTETSPLNPLTAYARSKVRAEEDLENLADDGFAVTCLRFATACGMSDRLRLDLVVNDFVACAIAARKITILSDGTPWRPLIHVHDMGRAIDWAIQRTVRQSGAFLAVNVGSNTWNYQVRDLAAVVAERIPGTEISINKDAPPDQRSYRVDFSLYERLAPGYLPEVDLRSAVDGLKEGLEAMGFRDAAFRSSQFMRLEVLRRLTSAGHLTGQMTWAARERRGPRASQVRAVAA
jgi:nucleoside-diphosphate-sugar epimerase